MSPIYIKAAKLYQTELRRAQVTLELYKRGLRPHIAALAARQFVETGQDPKSMPKGELRKALQAVVKSHTTPKPDFPEGPDAASASTRREIGDQRKRSSDQTETKSASSRDYDDQGMPSPLASLRSATGLQLDSEMNTTPFDAIRLVDQKLYAAQMAKRERSARARKRAYQRDLDEQRAQRTKLLQQGSEREREVASRVEAFEREQKALLAQKASEKKKRQEEFKRGLFRHMREIESRQRRRRRAEEQETKQTRQAVDAAVMRSIAAAQARMKAQREEKAAEKFMNMEMEKQKEQAKAAAKRIDDQLGFKQMAALEAYENERLRKIEDGRRRIQEKLDAMQEYIDVEQTPEQIAARRAEREQAEMEAARKYKATMRYYHKKMDTEETRVFYIKQMKEREEKRKRATDEGRQELERFFQMDREHFEQVREQAKKQHELRKSYGGELRQTIQTHPHMPIGRKSLAVEPPADQAWIVGPALTAKAGALEAVLTDLQNEHPTRLSMQAMQEIKAAGIAKQVVGSARASKRASGPAVHAEENPLLDGTGMACFADSPAKSRMAELDARSRRFRSGGKHARRGYLCEAPYPGTKPGRFRAV